MEVYFLKWATYARHLEEPEENQWIIELLQRACDWLDLLQPKTIWDAAQILCTMDKDIFNTNYGWNKADAFGEPEYNRKSGRSIRKRIKEYSPGINPASKEEKIPSKSAVVKGRETGQGDSAKERKARRRRRMGGH